MNYPLPNFQFLILLLGFMSGPISVFGQASFGENNLAYQYDPNLELHLNWQLAHHPTEPLATFFLEWRVANAQYRRYSFAYQWVAGYDTPLSSFSPLAYDSLLLHKGTRRMIWEWEMEYAPEKPLLIIQVTNELSGNKYLFDLPAQHPTNFTASDLVLKNAIDSLPHFTSYVVKPQEVLAQSLYHPQAKEAYLYAYDTDFDAALPPMTTRSTAPSRSMTISNMRKVNLQEPLPLREDHLYLLQLDTASLIGLSFWYRTQAFPKYNQANALLPPTTYLSSRREQAAILEAPDVKTALDQFWLGAANQSPTKARTAIRNYYRAVTHINQQFSTYKAGWKTDMGMIMAVFGLPDEVYRSEEEEIWVYQRIDGQRVTFVFDKIKNIFTRQHYALRRQAGFSELWQDQIDLWRKGLIEW